MQMSGGHLLAAGLDGGNTVIFFPAGKEMQFKSLHLRQLPAVVIPPLAFSMLMQRLWLHWIV